MKKYKNHSLAQYLDVLSQKTPTPGGGSVSALAGACGAGLLSMVTNYSLGKGQPAIVERKLKSILKQAERLRKRFLELVDLDAEAYEKVVKARKGTKLQKKSAQVAARKIPMEVCRLSYQGVESALFLARYGNKYLVSDVSVATDMLLAAYNGSTALLDS